MTAADKTSNMDRKQKHDKLVHDAVTVTCERASSDIKEKIDKEGVKEEFLKE